MRPKDACCDIGFMTVGGSSSISEVSSYRIPSDMLELTNALLTFTRMCRQAFACLKTNQ